MLFSGEIYSSGNVWYLMVPSQYKAVQKAIEFFSRFAHIYNLQCKCKLKLTYQAILSEVANYFIRTPTINCISRKSLS